MIRLYEAALLARTKIKTHKIRTGLAIGISGLLFGLIVSVLLVTQGVFSSINSFSKVGLNDRTILSVFHSDMGDGFQTYDHMDDAEFIKEVEAAHASLVQKKTAAAKKYAIEYDAVTEDPSPVVFDASTKSKRISEFGISNQSVLEVVDAKNKAEAQSFSIDEYIKPYDSAILRGKFTPIRPVMGSLEYMKEGKEVIVPSAKQSEKLQAMSNDSSLSLLDGSVAAPFIQNTSFDPSKGEIPVILPVSAAEKLLGFEPQSSDVSAKDKRERLTYLQQNVEKITTSFCYRNNASIALLAEAVAQRDEIRRYAASKDYVKPSLLYTVPSDTDCGAVTISSDTRTAAEKKAAENRVLYEKEIGAWQGEPQQQKVMVRGVGISSDAAISSSNGTVSAMIQSLLSSSLGFNTWAVPINLLQQVPEAAKPASLFALPGSTEYVDQPFDDNYLVEFTDKEQARALFRKTGYMANNYNGSTYAYPFGSGTLVVDEARGFIERALFIALLIVSIIAAITMAGIIGRTISDGRRESAVFRAIGASRSDIASIYGMYTILLSLRVVLFAAVLGLTIAIIAQVLLSEDASIGAQLAYASADTKLRFNLIGLDTWLLPALFAVIMAVGIISAIVPIILGSQRSPIRDMRNE